MDPTQARRSNSVNWREGEAGPVQDRSLTPEEIVSVKGGKRGPKAIHQKKKTNRRLS